MGMDPSSQFSLLKFESKKNKRQSLSADYGGMMKKVRHTKVKMKSAST
jgi:hypothetical protein